MVCDLIIIGGGPAAVSAAIYAARKKINFKTLAQKIGGEQLFEMGKIENYPGIKSIPSGMEFIKMLRSHLEEYNIDIKEGEEVVKIEKKNNNFLIKTKKGSEYETKAIIIASGKKPRKLGVPGEKEFEGKGVSYCSICDAPLFLDKNVAVVGGGNAGLDSALDLIRYANKVYVLEFGPKIIGDASTQEKLKESGKVEFIVNALTQEIKGEKFIKGLVYQDKKTGKTKELLVEGVFVHVGSITSIDFVKGFLEINSANEIVINHKTCQTSIKGIFAAGDVTDVHFKQIVIAAGQGAIAALSAHQYLEEKHSR